MKLIFFSIFPALVLFGLLEGISQLYWIYLEKKALNTVSANGEKILRNDTINFIKQPDGFLGYRLQSDIPGWTNSRGFAQIEEITESRTSGSLRILAVGESTTQGLPQRNYPVFLSQILETSSYGYRGNIEVLNAGVSGWVSDQWAVYSERELHAFTPDIVIIYGGWNDFQSYDPLNGVPKESYFQSAYGFVPTSFGYLKSVVLGSAILRKLDWRNENGFIPIQVNWQNMENAKVHISLNQETEGMLEPSGYVSILVKESQFFGDSNATYTVKFKAQGSGPAKLHINGYGNGTWPTYAECPISLSNDWKEVECSFIKPSDDHGVQVSLFSGNDRTLNFREKDFKLFLSDADGSSKLVAVRQFLAIDQRAKHIYRFLFDSINRTIEAFRSTNPDVKFILSSLVSRWPMDTEEQFHARQGRVWWMERHGIDRGQAAVLVSNLNKELRRFAEENGLLFVDMAKVFRTLDRQRLMVDFCHMTDDGYKIMAATFYKELVQQNLVHGKQHEEYEQLVQEYTLPSS